VSDTGTLVRPNPPGSISASRTGTGVYAVNLGQNISDCSYLGSIGDTGTASGPAGLIRTHLSPSNTSVVIVETFRISANGSTPNDDYPFHLGVFCTP
jgi:hypothetical protein